ncbi:TetR family transcriptional regulator [Citricoccus sp.]|uniref:TetR family transcriptional regulator n=1 Tax=Citricoccus sp. TaxID=1978372 RepID=UPI0028BEB788|nr:TetR family transcriptional regulator [Citricoccus sp.]
MSPAREHAQQRSHRETSRQAARARIGYIAEALFLEHGYEATTVDQIAQEAGISRRTFFRYFSTKDEVLFGNTELDLQALLRAVDSRPAADAPWISLEDAMVGELDQDDHLGAEGRARLFATLAAESPEVHSRYLARLATFQVELQELLWARWVALHGAVSAKSVRVALRALAGAFFAILDDVVLTTDEGFLADHRGDIAQAFELARPGDIRFGGPNRAPRPTPEPNASIGSQGLRQESPQSPTA